MQSFTTTGESRAGHPQLLCSLSITILPVSRYAPPFESHLYPKVIVLHTDSQVASIMAVTIHLRSRCRGICSYDMRSVQPQRHMFV